MRKLRLEKGVVSCLRSIKVVAEEFIITPNCLPKSLLLPLPYTTVEKKNNDHLAYALHYKND